MTTSRISRLALLPGLAFIFASGALAQSVLSLSTGSAAPGGTLTLNLSLTTLGVQPASLQWTLNYTAADISAISITAGAAATAASKTISCNNTTGTFVCAVTGVSNSTVIQNGVVAVVHLTISAATKNTSTSIPVGSAAGVSATGNSIATTASGAVVTITQPVQPTVTTLSCSPTTVTPPAAPSCTVTLSSQALTGGAVVGLTSNSANLVVPATVTVPAAATSVGFTPTTTAVSVATPVQLTATLGSSSAGAQVNLSAACTYTLTPGTRLYTAGGGSGNVSVTAPSGCAWSASTNVSSWITLPGSGGASGNGNGSFVYSVVLNTTRARLGSVTVGNQSFKVMQGGSTSIVPYNDELPSDPYFDYVSLMASEGITDGCSASPPLYCPSTAVTRAQMATFVVAALDLQMGTPLSYSSTQVFQDVPSTGSPDSPYFPFVQKIYALGITDGCSSSPEDFCPDQSITQGQMAVFMITSWMYANGLSTFTYTQTPYFTDVLATDPFFKFIQKMRDLGFWSGCSATLYCETSAVTRDDMAPMVMRAILGTP